MADFCGVKIRLYTALNSKLLDELNPQEVLLKTYVLGLLGSPGTPCYIRTICMKYVQIYIVLSAKYNR